MCFGIFIISGSEHVLNWVLSNVTGWVVVEWVLLTVLQSAASIQLNFARILSMWFPFLSFCICQSVCHCIIVSLKISLLSLFIYLLSIYLFYEWALSNVLFSVSCRGSDMLSKVIQVLVFYPMKLALIGSWNEKYEYLCNVIVIDRFDVLYFGIPSRIRNRKVPTTDVTEYNVEHFRLRSVFAIIT